VAVLKQTEVTVEQGTTCLAVLAVPNIVGHGLPVSTDGGLS